MLYRMIPFLLGCITYGFGQIDLFHQPWKDTNTAIVIDLYGGNSVDWDLIRRDRQLTAIIHKSSQGSRKDTMYHLRRIKAKEMGYKWGSYHLGNAEDPIMQADFYLEHIGNNPDELMALDLESDDSTRHMSIHNAILFVSRIYEKTGRYPLLYCNKNMLVLIQSSITSDCILKKCKLWYARFRSDIPDFDPKIWSTYTLWQFSSEINCKKSGECLYNVAGTLYDMDINVYCGTKQQLIENWPLND